MLTFIKQVFSFWSNRFLSGVTRFSKAVKSETARWAIIIWKTNCLIDLDLRQGSNDVLYASKLNHLKYLMGRWLPMPDLHRDQRLSSWILKHLHYSWVQPVIDIRVHPNVKQLMRGKYCNLAKKKWTFLNILVNG